MLYHSFRSHRRSKRTLAPDSVLVKTSVLDSDGIVRDKISKEIVSGEVSRLALEGMQANDFSIAVAQITGNVGNLKPCPVLGVSDFVAADNASSVVEQVNTEE